MPEMNDAQLLKYAAIRAAELEAENDILRHEVEQLQSKLASADAKHERLITTLEMAMSHA